jgi:hypothetical protein
VSLALVGCHDDLELVALQLGRFGEVEENALTTWTQRPDLPLHGHCWLDRFDFHMDKVEASLSSLADLRTLVEHLDGPIRSPFWKTMARLCSRWRYRAPEKLESLLDAALVEWLVSSLEGPYQKWAAICLARLWQVQAHLSSLLRLRPKVVTLLPDLCRETRLELQGYVDSSGLTEATIRRRGQADQKELERVRRSTSLDRLREFAAHPRGEIASEAALRLLNFGETGAAVLLELLLSGEAAHPPVLAETAGLWPAGPSRDTLSQAIRTVGLDPEVVFCAGLSLLEDGEPVLEATLEAARRPTSLSWFQREFWQRLLNCGCEPARLALELASSPHPHAYSMAVQTALEEDLEQALVSFLESGWERRHELRLTVARRLWEKGDRRGFPLLFRHALNRPGEAPDFREVDLSLAVESGLLAGSQGCAEEALAELLLALPPSDFERWAPMLLRESRQTAVCQRLLHVLPPSGGRQQLLTRLAQSCLWGVKMGRQLTGRLFGIELLGGQELGYTRLEEDRIFINPLPMLRGERHGREVVEGLILHELGHHIYHRGTAEQQVWTRAQGEGLHQLLNLVSDEHLERNLRAKNLGFDRRLKRLAAFAFLHDQRELEVHQLISSLQHQALPVLSQVTLGVACRAGCVSVRSGAVLSTLEKEGSSFIRFVRGLRTGQGNRHNDPKVEQALQLFGPGFRRLTLSEQYPIASRLREIFGMEVSMLDTLSQDAIFEADPNEILVLGEGLTGEELRREMERLNRPGQESSSTGESGTRWLNKTRNLDFPPISMLQPVAYDPALAAEYIRQVARHARSLRQTFQNLGLAYERQTHRARGHRLDRARVANALLKGDVRILQARRLVVKTDLFLGVLVDCSGSMTGDCMHKARLFATLVAQAVQGLGGVELRVLGFTDSTLYDAGDARRCAAHNLMAGGGNNDAGALDFAAGLARRSRRRARLLLMISDGLPTQCSVAALSNLVHRLGTQEKILCAQVAVRPLKEVCFPHYIELSGGPEALGAQVAQFGRIVAQLSRRALA